jgi:DNA-binding IclR family transcriptional regulator
MRAIGSTLGRAVDVIELLAAAPEGMRLSAIADRLELPKSGVHRLLAPLSLCGWLDRDAASERYRLSSRFAILGLRLLLATRLPELCQPILDRLAHETRELVRLTLVQDARLVWIAAAQGAPPGLMYQPAMHGDVVLHTTANGKAWLATLPPTEAMRILKARGLAAVGSSGPRALRSYEAIADDLQRTRLRGWGLAEEEAESGVAAIARAIRPRAPSGAAVGTVSVAGPIVRVTPERYASLADRLDVAAQELALVWPLAEAPRRAVRARA